MPTVFIQYLCHTLEEICVTPLYLMQTCVQKEKGFKNIHKREKHVIITIIENKYIAYIYVLR